MYKNIEKSKLLKDLFIFILSLIIFLSFYDISIDKRMSMDINKIKFDEDTIVLNWTNMKNDFEFLVDKYKYLIENETNIPEDSPIWMMWYQGIENAPPIVKTCFASIFKNRGKHPIYILNKNNINKYLRLPRYIIEKFKKGIIRMAHFSDIIRMGLLLKYGGYWIDSSYFITTPLEKVNTNFFTLKPRHCFVQNHPFIDCSFSINFLAVPKNSFIAAYSFASLLFYWKKYNSTICYFLLDYIFKIAYNKLSKFKKIIDDQPYIECDIFSLYYELNKVYDKNTFKCPYNKLNKSGKFIEYIKTNFGYITENYEFNLENESNNNINYK